MTRNRLIAKKGLNREEQWDRYHNIARWVAWRFSRKYHRSYTEMEDIAEYALALALWGGEWEPERGERSTFLLSRIHHHLLQVVTRGTHPCPSSPTSSLKVGVREGYRYRSPREIPATSLGSRTGLVARLPDPSPPGTILRELSGEARALVRVVLETPGELAGALTVKAPRRSANLIRDYLAKEMGWSEEQIDRVWGELKESMGTKGA